MARFLDARIPVVFVPDAASAMPDDALLLEGAGAGARRLEARFTADPTHVAGCSCCTGRSSAARALSILFLARARGSDTPFSRVAVATASQAGEQAVKEALANDVLASQWFRLA